MRESVAVNRRLTVSVPQSYDSRPADRGSLLLSAFTLRSGRGGRGAGGRPLGGLHSSLSGSALPTHAGLTARCTAQFDNEFVRTLRYRRGAVEREMLACCALSEEER
uniref:Uncharacterized protein n=1 Tax=Plectus sambesii TaxID=2011161 RepID=A0A914ULT6_9BILA